MTKANRIAPSNRSDRGREPTPFGSKESLGLDPTSGAETFILRRNPGFCRPERRTLLEYHTCHEQSFLLEDSGDFAGWYDWRSPGFMTHPPYWWHPAGYSFQDAGMTLVKLDKPVDFLFSDIPDGWDGTEWFAPEDTHHCRNRVISNAWLDDAPWEPVRLADGSEAGFDAKHVWDDLDTGWTTWLMRAPAGWQGRAGWSNVPGGDEIYILDGDLTLGNYGIELLPGGYLYDPEQAVVGGEQHRSRGGFTAVRWSKGADFWRLPPNHLPDRAV